MTLAITTVCESIAALVIEGVKICDLKNIPPSAVRLTPILFPDPNNPISSFEVTRQSYGGGPSYLLDADYDLNYIFLYCEAGSGRTGLDYTEDRMLKVQAVYDAILSIDTFEGGVDISPTSNVQFTSMTDPGGKEYLGCLMTFHVKEFWR